MQSLSYFKTYIPHASTILVSKYLSKNVCLNKFYKWDISKGLKILDGDPGICCWSRNISEF